MDAWGARGLKKQRFESVKKAGVNACEKQTSEVQDRLEAGGLQNGIGKCIFKVSLHEKSPCPTRTRRNTSLIDAIESLNSETSEKSMSGNSSKLKGGWGVNLEKEWRKDDYCWCCQLSISYAVAFCSPGSHLPSPRNLLGKRNCEKKNCLNLHQRGFLLKKKYLG